ncbi:MAG: nucleotidyltransferase domain-containing protein [Coriobacteriales bacterium]|jgi:predicted nucleotidyltransferase|nr:nucleotidyltransferase domain-containing protein [Coriobacteriales bacterium]
MTLHTRETKVPVSLRIPPDALAAVDNYALVHRTSKSDAFLHYLRKGLESDAKATVQLENIQASLDRILWLTETRSHANPSRNTLIHAVTESALAAPDIERVFLFGSYARGDETPESDIDLRIVVADDSSFSLFDLARFKKEVETRLGRQTDIISAREILNSRLLDRIEKEKVLIYERPKQ